MMFKLLSLAGVVAVASADGHDNVMACISQFCGAELGTCMGDLVENGCAAQVGGAMADAANGPPTAEDMADWVPDATKVFACYLDNCQTDDDDYDDYDDDGDDMPSTAEMIAQITTAEATCAIESLAAAALANADALADAVADGADAVADAVGDALANGGNALCEAAKTAKSQGSATCDAVPDMKDMCLAAFDTAIDFACGRRSRRGGHGEDDDQTDCEELADMLTWGAAMCSGQGRRVRLRRGGHGDMCDVAKTAKAQGAATCDAVPDFKDTCLAAFDTAIAFACDGAVPTIEFGDDIFTSFGSGLTMGGFSGVGDFFGDDGDDDDMDDMGMAAMQCMMASCGAEMGVCLADSECSAEMNAVTDDDDDNMFPTEADFKAQIKNTGPKYTSFMTCMWDECVAGMVAEMTPTIDASVCALVATVAKNPTISAALEDAGADLSSIKEGAAAGSSDSAVSTTAQLVTVAVAAAVALVW